jgi:nitrogenase-associated protein
MNIRFFEKPGCVGNARQKAILLTAGHQLQIENILEYPFTREELRSFFMGLEIKDWFNLSAPRIKSGVFDTRSISESQAIDEMLADRLLIRRPLLQFETTTLAGFSIDQLQSLGISCSPGPRMHVLDKNDLETCPGEKIGIKCSEPRTLPDFN